jgi:hypothetical protein
VEPENEENHHCTDVKFDETQLYKSLDDGNAEEVLQLVDVTLIEREIAPAIIPVVEEPDRSSDSSRDAACST